MEAVGLLIFLELEAHVLEEFHLADLAAQADRHAVGEVRLDIQHEVLALGQLFLVSALVGGFVLVHVPNLAPDLVGGQEAGGQAHGGRHELAAVHAQLAGLLGRDLAGPILDFLLLLGLRTRNVFLVGDQLRGHGRIDALLVVTLPFSNPHGLFPSFGLLGVRSRDYTPWGGCGAIGVEVPASARLARLYGPHGQYGLLLHLLGHAGDATGITLDIF